MITFSALCFLAHLYLGS